MISDAELRMMKPSAFLINTARGGLVDVDAVTRALQDNRLRGAAVDVLPAEPPGYDYLSSLSGEMIVTPHAAFFSMESTLDLQIRTAEAVRACLGGEIPRHLVNPGVLSSPNFRSRSAF